MFSFLLSFSIVIAQEKPVIEFDKTVHDFGEILEADGNVSTEFVIKNTGKVPLVINRVTASCGCTTPEWTKEPIAPGKTGKVKATYSTKGRIGPFSKTISVHSNAEQGTSVVTIKGNVLKEKVKADKGMPISMGDLKLKTNSIDFDWINNTESKTQSIEIANMGSMPMILKFDKLPKYLSIATDPVAIQPESKGKLMVTYNGPAVGDYGFNEANVQVIVNSDKKNAPNNILNVKAKVRDDISKVSFPERSVGPHLNLSSTVLNFGQVSGKETTQLLKVANSGKSNLIIKSIKPTSSAVKVSGKQKEVAPGEIVEFTVSIDPRKMTQENLMAQINLITNDPDFHTTDITITAKK